MKIFFCFCFFPFTTSHIFFSLQLPMDAKLINVYHSTVHPISSLVNNNNSTLILILNLKLNSDFI